MLERGEGFVEVYTRKRTNNVLPAHYVIYIFVGLKIVRIGGGSVSEDTKKYMLEEVAKPYMTKAGQIESINQSVS